jgi:Fe-S cluster assembly protein SufD
LFENEVAHEVDTPLHRKRTEAIHLFERLGFPGKKLEDWRYTSLRSVLKHDYKVLPAGDAALEFKDVKQYFLNDLDTYRLVFVDGKYSSWLSETTHRGYDVCTFSAALRKHRNVLDRYFGQAAPDTEHFVALNTAFSREGAYIRITAGAQVEKPIEIVHFTTAAYPEVMSQPRNLVVLEPGASCQIIERHQSLASNTALTNSVTEIFVEDQARLEYYKVQNDLPGAQLIDFTAVRQSRSSFAHVSTFTLGGKFVRNNLHFHLDGSGAEASLDGITVLSGDQFADHHTLVDHRVPHCQSRELYKGIYDQQSKGVFNGKVMVHKDAQKTNAFQQNDNLLLSDKASVDTKPQLEIFADDVKCSHGCTIGQLDEDALFYLRSRGIPQREARAMLMYAFSHAALDRVAIPELKSRINRLLATKLGVNIDFEL